MKTQHTPTPPMTMNKAVIVLKNRIDKGVMLVHGNEDWNEATKIAIRAVNNHEVLVKALENIQERVNNRIDTKGNYYLQEEIGRIQMACREALAAAKGDA